MRADTPGEEGVTLFTVVEPHEHMSSRSRVDTRTVDCGATAGMSVELVKATLA
jgi:hypothetical protein